LLKIRKIIFINNFRELYMDDEEEKEPEGEAEFKMDDDDLSDPPEFPVDEEDGYDPEDRYH